MTAIAEIEISPAVLKTRVILHGDSHAFQIAFEIAGLCRRDFFFGRIERENEHRLLGKFSGARVLAIRFGPNVDVVKFARTTLLQAGLVGQARRAADKNPCGKVLWTQERAVRVVLWVGCGVTGLREYGGLLRGEPNANRTERKSDDEFGREERNLSNVSFPWSVSRDRAAAPNFL